MPDSDASDPRSEHGEAWGERPGLFLDLIAETESKRSKWFMRLAVLILIIPVILVVAALIEGRAESSRGEALLARQDTLALQQGARIDSLGNRIDSLGNRIGRLADSLRADESSPVRPLVVRPDLALDGIRDTLREILQLLKGAEVRERGTVRTVLIFRGDYSDPPRPVDISVPPYPEFAKAAGNEGEVTVFATIGRHGNVAVVDSVRPHTPLAEPLAPWAASTVGRWVFRPARGGGRDMEARVDVVFAFVLQP